MTHISPVNNPLVHFVNSLFLSAFANAVELHCVIESRPRADANTRIELSLMKSKQDLWSVVKCLS